LVEFGQNKGPKSIAEIPGAGLEPLRQLKSVTDLSFEDICKLIEGTYSFKLKNLDVWDEMKELRDTVNALKHRWA
jgi:hypothetical protein